MAVVEDDVTTAAGNLRKCGGQDVRYEVTVHSLHDNFISTELKLSYLWMQKASSVYLTGKLFLPTSYTYTNH